MDRKITIGIGLLSLTMAGCRDQAFSPSPVPIVRGEVTSSAASPGSMLPRLVEQNQRSLQAKFFPDRIPPTPTVTATVTPTATVAATLSPTQAYYSDTSEPVETSLSDDPDFRAACRTGDFGIISIETEQSYIEDFIDGLKDTPETMQDYYRKNFPQLGHFQQDVSQLQGAAKESYIKELYRRINCGPVQG